MLTQKRLKELLRYEPNTGDFTRKINISTVTKGEIAGNKRPEGYTRIDVDGKKYYAQRLVWLYVHGYFPEYEIDHKDRDKTNNRIKNLRIVTHTCNLRNTKIRSNNRTGITGVCINRCTGKWRSLIMIGGIQKYLGSYIDLVDAVKARWEGEKKYNFPNCNTTSSSYLYLKERELL